MKKIIAALAGVGAGLALLFAPAAQGTPKIADDCQRVAKGDRAVCRQVQRQHPYGAVVGGGQWSAPSGRVLVHEITHQGLTRWEMGDALRGEAATYRQWVTGVSVNMDRLAAKCGSDGQYVIKFRDEDGKPGGRKLTEIVTDCA